MKTHAKFRRFVIALGLVANLNLFCSQGRAQTNDGSPTKEAKIAAGQAVAPMPYDIEIEHGLLRARGPGRGMLEEPANLQNIVKHLRDRHPEANIAMAPELAIQVEDLKIHAAELAEELEAIRVASGGGFIWKVQDAQHDHNPQLFSIEASDKTKGKDGDGPAAVEVFNFSGYFARLRTKNPADDAQFQIIEQQMVDRTQEIVAETVNTLGISAPFKFNWHQGANLMVVTGTPKALEVAKKVINAMIEPSSGDADSGAPERRFSVLGQVERPGGYYFPQNGSVNLLDAIAKAGGYTRLGDPRKVNVRRTENGSDKIYHVNAEDMEKDPAKKLFEILPGDNITVSERQF